MATSQAYALAVHPRTSGEHTCRQNAANCPTGSSPHKRGTLQAAPRKMSAIRFIPAQAGNTISLPVVPVKRTVHPRTSGEHKRVFSRSGARDGSSPHKRGTPLSKQRSQPQNRFIPAQAGNTPVLTSVMAPFSVHPRTSGEHGKLRAIVCNNVGSSPHKRGTLPRQQNCSGRIRFIPAQAGNTPALALSLPGLAVHPRTSGEHCQRQTSHSPSCGSSPHKRGTHFNSPAGESPGRFIPAQAGNTVWHGCERREQPVHPRTSGEHINFY